MISFEEVVALAQEAFPGHYVGVNVSQSTYGYPSARAHVITMVGSTHVAAVGVDLDAGATAEQALEALVEAIRAGRWVLEGAPSIAAEGAGL